MERPRRRVRLLYSTSPGSRSPPIWPQVTAMFPLSNIRYIRYICPLLTCYLLCSVKEELWFAIPSLSRVVGANSCGWPPVSLLLSQQINWCSLYTVFVLISVPLELKNFNWCSLSTVFVLVSVPPKLKNLSSLVSFRSPPGLLPVWFCQAATNHS